MQASHFNNGLLKGYEMKIHVQRGKIAAYRTEALVLAHFEDSATPEGMAALLDQSCSGQIRDLLAGGDFKGKLHQTSVLYTRGAIPAGRIVMAGLGKRADFNLEKLRGAYAKAVQQIRALNLKECAVTLDRKLLNRPLSELTEAVLEGMMLGLYRFTPYKTIDRENITEIQHIHIVEENEGSLKVIEESSRRAEAIAKAVIFGSQGPMDPSARPSRNRRRIPWSISDLSAFTCLPMAGPRS